MNWINGSSKLEIVHLKLIPTINTDNMVDLVTTGHMVHNNTTTKLGGTAWGQ